MCIFRGTTSDPIEFHVRENIADALIGQLIYKNVTREEYRSSNHRSSQSPPTVSMIGVGRQQSNPTRPTYSSMRQERFLNSRFNRNYTKLVARPEKQSKRRNRGLEDQFYVPVTPAVFYDENNDFVAAAESAFVPTRRRYPATMPSFGTHMKANVTIETANSRQVLPTTEYYPKEVVVTPRPARNKGKQSMSSAVAPTAAASRNNTRDRAEKQIRAHSNGDSGRGLRFMIANQQDVTDMITITNDGTLMTLKPLDREERDIYRLTIIAEYFQGFVTGAGIYQVIIHVDDVNDNAPVFNLHSYSGSIAENSPVNTEVVLDQQMLVHDADIGENADFDLTLHGEGSQFFAIEKRNGTKRTFEQLLSFRAIGNQRFSRAIGKQKMKNFFDENNFLNVPHYIVKYIGPNVIDRELQNYYEFTVTAKDRGGLSSDVKMTLYVSDVNDNAPIFDKISVFKDVGVEVMEFSNDIEIFFVDRLSQPEALTYPIRHHMHDVDHLTPSASNNVNYEIMQLAEGAHIGTPRFINLNADNKNKTEKRPRARRRNNEKPYPIFSILESAEVGSVVMRLTASDEDYEENAQVLYKVNSEMMSSPRQTSKRAQTSNLFGIDAGTGELRVYRQLPAQAEIVLNVSAIDTGGLSDTVLLKFKVIDINDHAPVFEKPWYTFDITEADYKHMVLGKVVATDEDFGDNANITYNLVSSESHPFYVTPLTGILKINGELDRELKSLYELKVVASDNSKKEQRMTSTAEIEVNILDANDNAPMFIGYDEILTLNSGRKLSGDADDLLESINDGEMPYNLPVYKAYLNRNTEPGTFVKQISAMDKDFAGNGNGLVMYALRHSSLPYFFEIDSRDGVVMTIAKFARYHGYGHINLTVIASDLGTPSKSSIALLVVNLQGDDVYDEDDYADSNNLFQHKYYEIEVPENNVVPMMLLQINATNTHKERAFKWSLVPENGSGREFRIDPINGTLWLVRSLDREAQDQYRIRIRAEPTFREGRHIPSITYPIADERVSGLQENEVRVSFGFVFFFKLKFQFAFFNFQFSH